MVDRIKHFVEVLVAECTNVWHAVLWLVQTTWVLVYIWGLLHPLASTPGSFHCSGYLYLPIAKLFDLVKTNRFAVFSKSFHGSPTTCSAMADDQTGHVSGCMRIWASMSKASICHNGWNRSFAWEIGLPFHHFDGDRCDTRDVVSVTIPKHWGIYIAICHCTA